MWRWSWGGGEGGIVEDKNLLPFNHRNSLKATNRRPRFYRPNNNTVKSPACIQQGAVPSHHTHQVAANELIAWWLGCWMQRPRPAFERGSPRISHQWLGPFNNLYSLLVVLQREYDVLVVYEVKDGSGDLWKDATF